MTGLEGGEVQRDRPTLVSVAARAGVSRQTVSNVLNAPERVQPTTRSRVQAAIDEMGYRPSSAARQLRTARSRTVGLRLEPERDGISGLVLDHFLHALVVAAQASAHRVLLYSADDDDTEVHAFADLLDTRQVDGFVLTSTHAADTRTAWLADRKVAFSTFGRPWGATDPTHPWVDVDGAAGTRAATEHLLSAGHVRVGFLGWTVGSGVGDDRRSGWADALAAAGLAATAQAGLPNTVDAGEQAARRLLSSPAGPTALVCASDSLALGALTVARSAGAAVVGFDDSPAAAVVGLSSVRQPLAAVASACVQQVVDAWGAPAGPAPTRLLTPELVVRASSAGPPPEP